MDIVKLSLLAVLGSILAIVIKSQKNEYSQLVSLAIGIVVFFFISAKAGGIIDAVYSFVQYIDVDKTYIKILLKMTGITYIAEFSSSVCKDAGYSAIASQIEVFSKVSLLAISLPVVAALLETISGL